MEENIRIHSMDRWLDFIQSLKNARDLMEQAGKEMRKIVFDALTQVGITGDVGEALMIAYEQDVLVVINNFIAEVNAFINKNKKVYGDSEEALTKMGRSVKGLRDIQPK